MRALKRAAIYILGTAIIQTPNILILLYLGFPNNSSNWYGSLPFVIAVNLFLITLLGGAAAHNSYGITPTYLLVGGTCTMLIVLMASGELLNGYMRPKFEKELDSTVHNFVEATYSTRKIKEETESALTKMYSANQERVMARLTEVLEGVKSTGTPETALRLETLIKKLKSADNPKP